MRGELPPDERPGQPDQPEQPWNQKDFLDFLKRQGVESSGPENEDSPLDELDEELQEKIINNFEIYTALSDEVESMALSVREKLTDEKLHELVSLAEITSLTSGDMAEYATAFREKKLSGRKLLSRLQELVTVMSFIHQHTKRLTKEVSN